LDNAAGRGIMEDLSVEGIIVIVIIIIIIRGLEL